MIFLATHDANVTYGINLEMRPTGILKRTSFDLNLLGNHDNSHLLSVSMILLKLIDLYLLDKNYLVTVEMVSPKTRCCLLK